MVRMTEDAMACMEVCLGQEVGCRECRRERMACVRVVVGTFELLGWVCTEHAIRPGVDLNGACYAYDLMDRSS